MDVTFSGITTEVKLLHPEKASLPIEVTLAGNEIFSRYLHPAKALSPMAITHPGMIISERFSGHFIRVLLSALKSTP